VTPAGASVFESGLVSRGDAIRRRCGAETVSAGGAAHGVDKIRVVATSAMRDARNGAAFQAWVKAETGWNLEIISGLGRGRLIHLGVCGAEPGTGGKVLPGRLAGAVARFTLSEHKRIKETIQRALGRGAAYGGFSVCRSGSAEGSGTDAAMDTEGVARALRKIQPGKAPLAIADFQARRRR